MRPSVNRLGRTAAGKKRGQTVVICAAMWYNVHMEDMYTRTAALIGERAVERLKAARVAVFGIGGVGGHAAEAIVRCGVGHVTLVDGDVFTPSNLNRQLFATVSALGMPKTEAAKARLLDISPSLDVTAVNEFFTPESVFDFSAYDYVLDATDTVSAKMEIVMRCKAAGVRVISSMGAGNKLDPTAFRVTDIYRTSVCPLARVMRKLCRERGVESLKVVCSEEPPVVHDREPASVAFVPSACGLVMASAVVRDLIADV